MYKNYEEHLTKCREMWYKNKDNPEWRRKFRIRTRLSTRKYRENNLEECRKKEREKASRKKYKHIRSIRSIARCGVNNAVMSGILVKPKKCPRCGKSNNRIDGHHLDYDKPLRIIWLCSVCHGKEHRKEE